MVRKKRRHTTTTRRVWVPGTYRLEFEGLLLTRSREGLRAVLPIRSLTSSGTTSRLLQLAQDIVVTAKGQELAGYDVVLERGQYDNVVKNLTLPTITGTSCRRESR